MCLWKLPVSSSWTDFSKNIVPLLKTTGMIIFPLPLRGDLLILTDSSTWNNDKEHGGNAVREWLIKRKLTLASSAIGFWSCDLKHVLVYLSAIITFIVLGSKGIFTIFEQIKENGDQLPEIHHRQIFKALQKGCWAP